MSEGNERMSFNEAVDYVTQGTDRSQISTDEVFKRLETIGWYGKAFEDESRFDY